jgi:diguanylate cyclase (GGDEF)-like protein/putative nucleotidyltransferase with HDIG domain
MRRGNAEQRVTSIPSEHAPATDPADAPASRRSLPRRASLFLVLVALTTLAATAPLYQRLFDGADVSGWVPFAVLGIAAAVTQLFPVGSTKNQMLHTSIVFLCAAALLVPPELLVLLCLLVCVPEWLKERYPWYIQVFNICNYTLNVLAAWGVAHLVEGADAGFLASDMREAVAGVLAAVTFVVANRILLGIMLHLGRGHPLRGSFNGVSLDLVLTMLGVALAAFWETNPWLIPIALAPLLALHRTLSVPALEAEARVDPKTGLFNARYFATAMAEEMARAERFGRPMSLMMADLDLLRDINNSYGHLAGDAVLKGIAEVFQQQLRHYDVPARFGGEEFSILLPETPPEQALEIAERIRRAVAERTFDVETSSEPIRATVSIGVAAFPIDAHDSNELIHQADLAVYRAKLQGRNRVLGASSEPLLIPSERSARLAAVPDETPPPAQAAAAVRAPEAMPAAPKRTMPEQDRRSHPRPHALSGPRFFSLSGRLSTLVALVSIAGGLAGALGLIFGASTDLVGMLAVTALVGVAQALALEAYGEATLSVSAVGALAGAALFGPRAALAIAVTTCVVEWSARRPPLHTVLFNVATLTLASIAAAAVFSATPDVELLLAAAGVLAGAVYFAINMGLVSLALAVEGHESWRAVFRERFAWLLPSYVVYGFVGGVIAIGYEAAGLYALAVFAVPLLLMRKTMEAYLAHTQKSAQKLRQAAETIQTQNVSLEQANKLLKERSTAAMESLSATVDARDSYTAGHSRRVQQLALAIGREMGLSQAELDLLGHAALFHDIGKLAIPDAVLLKPASLTHEEWELMQRHADEGARIIDRLGFLNDAVPAIRHHHERWDGSGYPDRLQGEDIPLGARIIHVADALDSMLTTRIYRAARPAEEALGELRRATGKQFCPRTVAALERILANEGLDGVGEGRPADLRIAS